MNSKQKSMAAVRLLVVAALAVSGSGCATIFSGTTSTISVTSNPAGADVLVGGMYFGKTPAVVPLSKGETRTISVVAPGYQQQNCFLNKQLGAGWVVLDVLFFFPINMIVDAVTGAWNYLDPTACAVTLTPATGYPAQAAPDAYPPGAYPQGAYPPGAYPHPAYPQNAYPQPAYPQGAAPQAPLQPTNPQQRPNR